MPQGSVTLFSVSFGGVEGGGGGGKRGLGADGNLPFAIVYQPIYQSSHHLGNPSSCSLIDRLSSSCNPTLPVLVTVATAKRGKATQRVLRDLTVTHVYINVFPVVLHHAVVAGIQNGVKLNR